MTDLFDDHRVRIGAILIALVTAVVGIVVLAITSEMVLLGVFLMLWSQDLTQQIRIANQRERDGLKKTIVEAVARLGREA